MSLSGTQRWFAGAVMNGERLDETDRRLTRGPRLEASARLDVYRHGYAARLVECLADDYPVLRHALGADAFQAKCHDYIARFPSESPSLNAFGRHMASTCEGFEADLARLEWAVVEVIHAPTRAPLTMEALASVPPEAWASARLSPAPALRLLELAFPANDYFQAVKDGGEPAVPSAAASATVVHRSGPTVWRTGLTPTMHRVLGALLAGTPLESALDRAGDISADEVTRWFRDWMGSGLFVGVERPDAG